MKYLYRYHRIVIIIIGLIVLNNKIHSQISLSGQLRTRTEFRDGQGAPLSKGLKPAMFTSQRTRLTALFNSYRIKMGVTIQDVRVWGQDISTINRTTIQDNNGLLIHEAWAEIRLNDTIDKTNYFGLKIGRQELIYDDQRLLGNLDWLQQGRRHDAAVFKYEKSKWLLHAGAAFNQNKENASGTQYISNPNYAATTNGGTMYKSFEYLYANRKFAKGILSFLFFTDQFNKYNVDSSGGAAVKNYTRGTWTRGTTGLSFTNKINKLDISASAYYQFGKNGAGRKNDGYLLTIASLYPLNKFKIGPGIDYTSKNFDPLYGTPHKFWGLMDYFYAGSLFGSNGLVDYFLKSKFDASEKFSVTADLHHFNSASSINGYSKQFGQEIDIVGTFRLTRLINFEAGYSHFFATSALASPAVKNIANARTGANWAYLMINIKPEFLFK